MAGEYDQGWLSHLRADPLPWLLDEGEPAVRHLTLRDLLGRVDDDPELARARHAALTNGPIAAILSAQHPHGYWEHPGSGYAPKYTGTLWQVIFLEQLGADGSDPRIRAACDYVLRHAQVPAGGFGVSRSEDRPPPPSAGLLCLTGNLVRALVGLGYLEDDRVQRAVQWLAQIVTGEGVDRYYSLTCGPLFRCGNNEQLPCAWGAVKVLGALARVPEGRRTPLVEEAVRVGAGFLLSRDPAVADYPMGYGNDAPNSSWFKLGFPLGYVTDVLQNLEVLCEIGHGGDPRTAAARAWVLSLQGDSGRWRNQYPYTGKLWKDIDAKNAPSKWVTLRACRMLRWSTGRDGA